MREDAPQVIRQGLCSQWNTALRKDHSSPGDSKCPDWFSRALGAPFYHLCWKTMKYETVASKLNSLDESRDQWKSIEIGPAQSLFFWNRHLFFSKRTKFTSRTVHKVQKPSSRNINTVFPENQVRKLHFLSSQIPEINLPSNQEQKQNLSNENFLCYSLMAVIRGNLE